MKKIISCIAAVLMVSALHAASINWTITGSATAVTEDYLHGNYSGKAYFVLADEISLGAITSTEQTKEEFFAALSGITLNDEFSFSNGIRPVVTKEPVDSELLEEKVLTPVGLLIVAEDEVGNGFYKISINSGITPYATGAPSSAHTFGSTAASFDKKTWVQGYAVPEPATGALALAGLALLFRRKRA